MRFKGALIVLFYFLISCKGFSQDPLFLEAFEEFATSRLWEFEEIPIDWKMEGLLQADLNEGLNNLIENNLNKSEASLTSVIKRDSSVWQAYYYRAAARKKMEKFWLAKKDIERVLKLRGDFYEGLVEYAKILHLHGDVYESERTINKAIRLDRSRGAAYYIKGDINMYQGQAKSAIKNYDDCISADSLFHDARIKLALLESVTKKDVTFARRRLDQVLAYDSLQKNALLFRSVMGHQTNKKQAIADLTNLLLVNPNSLMARYYRGLFYAELEDYERSFTDFHNVIKTTATDDNKFVGQQTWLDKKIDLQNVGAYVLTRVFGLPEEDGLRIKQAYCQILISEYDKSLAALEKVSNARKEPVAVYLKAVAYEHKGEHIKALQQYTVALVLDNQIEDAYKKRGIYEQEMKQWDKSVSDFSAVLRLNPNAFFTNRMRGVSYYHMNKFEEAIADFNVYLRNDSSNKEVIGFRGMAYLNSKQRLKAYVDFAASDNRQALDLNDIVNLIDSVLQRKDTVLALNSLDVITEGAPYFTEAYAQKFKIHLARNQWNLIEKEIPRAVRHSRADAPPAKQSYLLTLHALFFAKNNHTDDAIKTLTEAIKLDARNDFAYLERGRLFISLGKTSKAESDLKKASDLGNRDAQKLLVTIAK